MVELLGSCSKGFKQYRIDVSVHSCQPCWSQGFKHRKRSHRGYRLRKEKTYRYELYNGSWAKRTYGYFREYGMGYGYRTLCCLQAKTHGNFHKEVSKIDCFKYINTKEFDNKNNDFYMCSILYHFSKKVDLVEKLQKSGLSKLVYADFNTYTERDEIQYNKAESELTKMLGITKRNLNMLKGGNVSLENLRRLQNNNNISDMDYADLQNFSKYEEDILKACVTKVGVSLHKIIKYVKEQHIGAREYSGFLALSSRLKFDNKDLSYSMPKDFHKELDRLNAIEAEQKRIKAEEEKKFELAKASILASIKKEVESNKDLAEFFTNKKYMVYVPGSVDDFVNEGNQNHNCVGKKYYADAVAKKETFVFFIREANNPSASFVTCECIDGEITQIMFDHNQRVGHDTEVYQFADAFAKRLSATSTRKVA